VWGSGPAPDPPPGRRPFGGTSTRGVSPAPGLGSALHCTALHCTPLHCTAGQAASPLGGAGSLPACRRLEVEGGVL
jgi:hypothetical protein